MANNNNEGKRAQEYYELKTASRNLHQMLFYSTLTDFEKLDAIESYLTTLQNTTTIGYARPIFLENEANIVEFMGATAGTPATQDKHNEVQKKLKLLRIRLVPNEFE